MSKSGANYAHRIMDADKKRRGGKCQFPDCKATKLLEYHHVIPTEISGKGRGLIKRALDIRDNPEAYILLCRPHHIAQHPDLFGDKHA